MALNGQPVLLGRAQPWFPAPGRNQGAVYPNGILPWTARVDKLSTVLAADPNQLAAEVIAIEGTLGTNPHIENSPPVGNPVVFNSVSQRIHDASMGYRRPGCNLANAGPNYVWEDANGDLGQRAFYTPLYDDGGYYNGTDITIPANGWYSISAEQTIGWSNSGYVLVTLLMGASGQPQSPVAQEFWSWDFIENVPDNSMWGTNPKIMSVRWGSGPLTAGTRISVNIQQQTPTEYLYTANWTLRALFDRG